MACVRRCNMMNVAELLPHVVELSECFVIGNPDRES
jgi:hypothetical protein